MNHLGDTNKMVDTPRTETYVLNPLPQVVSAEWARQLERELNAANDRIKRLEEALDTFTCLGELTPMKWNRALQEAFDMARAVLKAKEDKQ